VHKILHVTGIVTASALGLAVVGGALLSLYDHFVYLPMLYGGIEKAFEYIQLFSRGGGAGA
jgi:hypothetical protein